MIQIKRVLEEQNPEILTFLAEENRKLFLTLHPEYNALQQKENYPLIDQRFLKYFQEEWEKKPTIYAAYCNDSVIGCGFIDRNGYLNSLFVKEEYQGQKIGSHLLQKLLESCYHFQIIFLDTMEELIPFYENFSFSQTDTTTNRFNIIRMKLERNNGYYDK